MPPPSRRRRARRPAMLLALLALAAPAAAAPLLEDENLVIQLPRDFQMATQGEQGAMLGGEYIPQGETVAHWSRMITVQVFRNLKGFDADRFGDGMRPGWIAACPGAEVQKIRDGVENGYPFAVWMFLCPTNPRTGQPENMFAKFISGADALYSVQYAYRAPLTKELIAPTMVYLGSVQVCDTRRADRPCVAPPPSPPAAPPAAARPDRP